MATLADPNMLQSQTTQATQAAQVAQKTVQIDKKPSVQFADVLKNQQQKSGSGATIRLLKNNPVGGAEVVKSAVGATKSGKLATASTTGATTTSAGTTTGVASTGTGADANTQSSIAASYNLMELNQDFNLQYLNLQENMQAESRQYTAMSNVSKTKSDTAKNSLSNVK